ncbi:MAG: hypothetical protein ACR2H1_00135, partial [Limisphaerales bacterium]
MFEPTDYKGVEVVLQKSKLNVDLLFFSFLNPRCETQCGGIFAICLRSCSILATSLCFRLVAARAMSFGINLGEFRAE